MHYLSPFLITVIFRKRTWNIKTQKKEIFLSFDDGPCKQTTPQLLDLLKSHNAKATFFCLGKNIKAEPEITERIVKEGHGIGNHSWSHVNGWKFRNKLSAYLTDIEKAAAFTSKKMYRPPYGRTTYLQRRALRKKGYEIVMWNFNSKDYKENINIEKCISKVKRKTDKGTLFLFHDSIKTQKNTLAILSELLPFWKEKGYEISAYKGKKS